MRKRILKPHEIVARPCPTCGAEKNEWCRGIVGVVYGFTFARLRSCPNAGFGVFHEERTLSRKELSKRNVQRKEGRALLAEALGGLFNGKSRR